MVVGSGTGASLVKDIFLNEDEMGQNYYLFDIQVVHFGLDYKVHVGELQLRWPWATQKFSII